MSETSSLAELARFVGRSNFVSDEAANLATGTGGAQAARQVAPKPRVTDLLAVVLTLSARTRRVVLPRVGVTLDVFAPTGDRAVRIAIADHI